MRIYKDIDLTEFEFWSGARQTSEMLTDDELMQIQYILEDEYPEGMDETTVNDIFWFEDDFIAECIGYDSYDQLWGERHSKTESRKRRMKESYAATSFGVLDKIRAEGDGIARYTHSNGLEYGYCLVPDNAQKKTGGYSLKQSLYYTLYTLIDSGYEDEVWLMGAFKRDYDNEEENEWEINGELYGLPHDYCIHNIDNFKVVVRPGYMKRGDHHD